MVTSTFFGTEYRGYNKKGGKIFAKKAQIQGFLIDGRQCSIKVKGPKYFKIIAINCQHFIEFALMFVLISLVANIDLRSQSRCIVSTYSLQNFEIFRLVK